MRAVAHMSKASKKIKKIYSQSIHGLAKGDLNGLEENTKAVSKYSAEIEDLRNDLFYFIKNLDESTIKGASNLYINDGAYLQDIAGILYSTFLRLLTSILIIIIQI